MRGKRYRSCSTVNKLFWGSRDPPVLFFGVIGLGKHVDVVDGPLLHH
ncbi:major facilitator superfamily transporter [Moniliophthora roreri]|nr:major facilitator superfamily transporter [Moniliophthora roreri]